jgi:hypothetical protein
MEDYWLEMAYEDRVSGEPDFDDDDYDIEPDPDFDDDDIEPDYDPDGHEQAA